MKSKIILLIFFISFYGKTKQQDESLLKGTMISSMELSSEQNTNLIKNAFDNRFYTQFRSDQPSNGWVGINLRSQYIITRIEWGINETDHNTYLLGIFEGANKKKFEDAVPLSMITTKGEINAMNGIDIKVRKRFQYIRYVGPSGQYCRINSIRIFGYSSSTDEEFFEYYKPSNLSLLVIHSQTGLEPVNKTDNIQCYLKIINNNEEKSLTACLQLNGNEALNLYKKSYYIIFNEDQTLLDFGTSSKKWVLVSNYGDKTLIRNLVSFEISKIFDMEYTVNCKPIDLMINGEYKGIYNLCEHIEVMENKINIQTMSSDDISEPEISGGYLLQIDGFAYLDSLFFDSKKGVLVSIRYPNADEIEPEQKQYIIDKFERLETEVYDNNLTNIDIESFVKYFLIEELIGNPEAYWNTYLYKYRNNDTFYFGPIWDNELSFDNDIRVYPVNIKNNYIFNYGLSTGTMDKFINQMIKNDEVNKKIKEMWEEVINNKLVLQDIYNYIDEKVELIKESKKYNFMRWNILDKQIEYNPKVYASYDEEINYLKKFIENRINWLDNFILNNNGNSKSDTSSIDNSINGKLDYDIDDSGNEINYEYLIGFYLKINIYNIIISLILIIS